MTRKRGSVNRRTRAREQVLQMLFSRDFLEEGTDLPSASVEVMDGVVIEGYAVELLDGIIANQERIDRVIENASDNWTISRMAPTDRAILRIAVFEMFFRPDIPSSVSINEAVELAQSFGGEDESYRFVNGVLGRVATQFGENGYPLPGADSGDSDPEIGVPTDSLVQQEPQAEVEEV